MTFVDIRNGLQGSTIDNSPIRYLADKRKMASLGFALDAKHSATDWRAGNAIFSGDNLVVLKMLEPILRGAVKCIYIDPPYNNQESYTHYKDAMSHEAWLENIVPRLKMLWAMLRDDGSLWVSIDDRELHYLKVALDQICERDSFVATVVWEHRISRENRRAFSYNHEYVIIYAKNPLAFRAERKRLPLTPELIGRYRNPDNDPRGPWQSVSLNVQGGHGTRNQFYKFVAPNGRTYSPPNGRCWALSESRMREELQKNNIWFGAAGIGVPRMKRFLSDENTGLTPETIWRASDVGTTTMAKKHLLELFPRRRQFDTPKPEALLNRILHIATAPGDLVLDGYLGSGTTAAVAHKMGRHYIGIERSRSAALFAADRLREVVKGEGGGISASTAWQGGGGYAFFAIDKDRE